MKKFMAVMGVLVVFGLGQGERAWSNEKTEKPKTKAPEEGSAKAQAPEEEVQLVEGIECGKEQDLRRLEVHTKGAGCGLHYIKHGKNSEIAVAKHGVDLCKEKLKGVRATLEKAGYQCK